MEKYSINRELIGDGTTTDHHHIVIISKQYTYMYDMKDTISFD